MSYTVQRPTYHLGASCGATPSFQVYCHTSPSGKRYVGWTSRGWGRRWRKHVESALAGSRLPFHCAIRKYGAGSFAHEVIATVSTEAEAKSLEVEWIARLGTLSPGGYNATSGGDGSFNPSADVRARIGRAHQGKALTDEQRAKISASLTGRKAGPHSPETRAKIGAAQIGKKLSPDHRAKLCAARQKRAPTSQETREKMAAAWTPAMRRAAADRLARMREAGLL